MFPDVFEISSPCFYSVAVLDPHIQGAQTEGPQNRGDHVLWQ